MTWRLLISFSVLLVHGFGGEVSGRVELRDSRLESVTKHSDYSGVVLSFTPAVPQAVPRSAAHTQMVQKNKTFSPHILPVLTGTIVDFPNYDPIFHNAFSSYSGQVRSE